MEPPTKTTKNSIYNALKSDPVDVKLAEYINNNPFIYNSTQKVLLIRKSPGIYVCLGAVHDYSESNISGAHIQTVPVQMGPVSRGPNTSIDQIEAVWVALTGHDTGGAAIDSYHLQWDASTNE